MKIVQLTKTPEVYNSFVEVFDISYIPLAEFPSRDDLFVIGLESDGIVAGMALVKESMEMRDDEMFKIHRIVFSYLNKSYWKQGMHQTLLDGIYENAKIKFVNEIVCNIRESNVNSIRSFTKNGFRFIRHNRPYRNGEGKLFFSRIVDIVNWSDQIPSVPGWYWRREGNDYDNAKVQHLNVYTIKDLVAGYRTPEDTKSFMVTYHMKNPEVRQKWANKPLDEYKTWWYGPILPQR